MSTLSNITIPQRSARHVLTQLVDIHVPVSVEYLQSNVILSVPRTFARTLESICKSVNHSLMEGIAPGSYS